MQQYFGIFVFGSGFSDIRINNSYRISKDLLYVDNGNWKFSVLTPVTSSE